MGQRRVNRWKVIQKTIGYAGIPLPFGLLHVSEAIMFYSVSSVSMEKLKCVDKIGKEIKMYLVLYWDSEVAVNPGVLKYLG